MMDRNDSLLATPSEAHAAGPAARVLVVGTGSIGRRHIANLIDLGAEVIAFSYRGRALSDPVSGRAIERVEDWRAALAQPSIDAVVVANGTDQHINVALAAALEGKHLFIEKPLANSLTGIDALLASVEPGGRVVEAGFMLRCHPNLRWIREQLRGGDLGELIHLRASVGQWLPDWRPGTDHRQAYSARRASGGGVIFDLIHELDIAHWLAGPIVDVSAMTRNLPCLEIETEAVAQIGLTMASGALAQIHLDYVRPGYGRDMELVCRYGVLRWDYVSGTVSLERAGAAPEIVHRVPEGFERNTMFREHMAHFLRRIRMPEIQPISPLGEAVHVLRVALASHQSAIERRHVAIPDPSSDKAPHP